MRITNPDGSTREAGEFLNPGDQLASGEASPLDKITDAGQGTGGISVAQVLNPGMDETAPGTALPMFRRTTVPRIQIPGAARTRNTTRSGW
jgi:hypothetical protein